MDIKPKSSSQRHKIICRYIPDELFEKNAAQMHFQQFGPCRVKLIVKRKSCLVEYDNYDNAQSAILNAGEYLDYVFSVNWYNSSAKKKAVKKEKDPAWIPDQDIQEELQAMAATGFDYKNKHSLRSDEVPKSKLKKTWKSETPKKALSKANVVGSNTWTTEELEFLNVLKQPAFSVEEKYKVLEARDKLIRLRTKKDINLTKSSTGLIGNCPDMCPEKERLMREIQHQVASYEQDANGKLNPDLAIKQYSRSSADQEVPLSHELRPVAVLQLTMGYLLHCIMDLADASLTDWYHFLWDRTRGIRKDITQQELCCQGSVALIEQCARFHIHCSARLVAEDPSVFDQKINTENLTKCLQTLKYMYHDLSLKGESCPNEAEFRAYIILLNLNDGNFMWEVQQLKPEIQKSVEVKFALDVYSAIDKNNYIKFFKLVHSTNYLNACILLRYFVQVRTKALATIVKSYSPRMPYTSFPLNELTSLLAFEDFDTAFDFISCYGLFLNELETHVVLDRKNFQLPEVPYTLDRAINVIESKRTRSVGEVVCGSSLPFPTFRNHTPHNSFFDNGLFIMEGALMDAIKDINPSHDQPDSTPRLEDSPKQPRTILSEPVTTPSEVATSIFKNQTDSNQAFGNQPKAASIFAQAVARDQFTSLEEQKTGLFAQPKPNYEQQHKLDIFKQLEQKPNIFSQKENISVGEQKTGNIFGQQQKPKPQEEQKSNIFEQSNIYDQKEKLNIFAQPGKISIFGNQNLTDFNKQSSSGSQIFGHFNQTEKFQQTENIFSSKPQTAINPNLITFDIDEPESPPNESSTILSPYTFKAQEIEQQERAKNEQRLKEIAEMKREELEERQRQKKETKRREYEKREAEKKELERQKCMEERQQRYAEQKRFEAERLKQQVNRLKIAAEEERLALELKNLLALEMRESIENLMFDLLTQVEEKVFLNKIAEKNKAFKMKLFLEKWQKKSKRKKRKRLEENPIWLPSRSVSEEAKELITKSQNLTLENMKRYKLGASIELTSPQQLSIEKLDMASIYNVLLESYTRVHRGFQKEMFWKVTISLPSSDEFKTGLRHIEEVTMEMFQWSDRYGNTKLVGQYIAENRLSYCLERKEGIQPVENNINGLLFVADELNDLLFQRIATSLESLSSFAQVPVAVVFINNNINDMCLDDFDEILEDNPQISDYKTIKHSFSLTSIANAIELGMEFLAHSINDPPPLQLDTLESFLHLHISELWKRMTMYTEWNSKYKWCLKSPQVVISLYNEAIERLKAVLLNESSLAYQDFPEEFVKLLLNRSPDVLPCDYRYFPSFWKKHPYRKIVSDTVDLFKISKYHTTWPPQNERQLEKDIYDFCKNNFEESQRAFYNTMAAILRGLDPQEEFCKIGKVSWLDVIQALFKEKLNSVNFLLKPREFNRKSSFNQLFVIYDVHVLNKFRGDDWFYLSNATIQEEIVKMPQSTKVQAVQAPAFDLDLDEIEKSLQDQEKEDARNTRREEIKKIKDLMKDLEGSMKIQREIYNTVNKKFKLGDSCS